MLQSIATAIGTLLIVVVILFLTYICTKYIGTRMSVGRYAGGSSRKLCLYNV